MIDFFTYNGKNVLPEYLPGIPSYGQEGAPGNTGAKGSSIYYSAYCLSNPSELEEANRKIKTNSLLSNNPDYTSPSYAVYQKDDLIIDSESKFYILKEIDGELKISNVTSSENGDKSASKRMPFKDFKVKCITGLTKSSNEYRYDVPNELYDKDEAPFYSSISKYYKISPFIYHSQQYRSSMFGNYLYFYVVPSSGNSSYHYKFCLTLPNGETLTSHSDTGDTIMYIDNRHLFACPDFYTYKFNLPDEAELKFLKIPIGEDNKPKSLSEYFPSDHGFWSTYDIGRDEGDPYVTLLASFYLQERATAYFEATDLNTSKTYRVDLNDIFYTPKNSTIPSSFIDESDIIGREDFVRPATINIGWDVVNLTKEMYLSEGYELATEYLEKQIGSNDVTSNLFFCVDNNETYNFNQFNEFAILESYKSFRDSSRSSTSIDSPTTAEDGRTFRAVFLNTNTPADGTPYGTNRYLAAGSDGNGYGVLNALAAKEHLNAQSELTLLGDYNGMGGDPNSTYVTGGCPNKVLRLYFRKLKELVVTVRYNILFSGTYPATVVYIGKPNTHIFQCSNDPKTLPGIYYLNRIIPYKYSDTLSDEFTTLINGDQATVTIDVSAYSTIENSNEINFIEIGFASINDSISSHKVIDYYNTASGAGYFGGYYDVAVCVTNVSVSDTFSEEYDNEIAERESQEEENTEGTITEITGNETSENSSNTDDSSNQAEEFDGNYFIKGGFIPAPKINHGQQ